MGFPRLTVEARKFCCCLPVRLGVFVLSLVAMIGGSIVGAVGWMSVARLKQNPVEITDEIALYIHSGIFTLLGVLGICGFVGSLVKSRGMVISFSVGLAIHLGLSIGSGVFTMYTMFKENPKEAVEACMQGKTDDETRQVCQTGMNVVKGAIVAIYIIAWLIELYAYFIVERYASQLDDEEFARLVPVMPQQPYGIDMRQGPYGRAAPYHPDVPGYHGGYTNRFSYGAYAESRRSYIEPPRQHKEFEDSQRDLNVRERERPRSAEYAFTLPQQAYGVQRGKDASNGV